jgi:hypothetical protein
MYISKNQKKLAPYLKKILPAKKVLACLQPAWQ